MIRVLVVDDQEDFRRLARTMLEEDENFQVMAEASDGVEAVEIVEEQIVDLVLMDVQMPRMNGFEATRRILDRHPEIQIVLVSISRDMEILRSIHKVGAAAFISKSSLTMTTLRQAIGTSR